MHHNYHQQSQYEVGLDRRVRTIILDNEVYQRTKSDVKPPKPSNNRSLKNKFLGNYERHPIEHGSHKAFIYEKNEQLWWRNHSREIWRLVLQNGVLSAVSRDNSVQVLQYEINKDRDVSSVIFSGESFKHTKQLSEET